MCSRCKVSTTEWAELKHQPNPEGPARHLNAARQKLPRDNYFQSNLSGDTFSMEAPQNLLRTKDYSKNMSSGKEFPFKSRSKLLRTFFWCLYRKGLATHAYLIIAAVL